tara:strand:+ start:430 stop:1761 length:1332 start_codon:yes stop_codon:yes gene_type:complete
MLKLLPWGSEPSGQGMQGGDLYGVIDSLEYLQDFGINCIYLNPIFLSSANHRYHTIDYFNVDPILGGNKALEALIVNMHERGMRLILDGVFNHCGRGFWAFNDLLENGKSSAYRDWFYVYKWPLNPYPKKKKECGYYCWFNDPALPKFNHENSHVRNYLLSVATFWLEKGIDGWRLDVPNEIPIDFWVEFRSKVKGINPDAWILGEIWGDARPWLQSKIFDGVMNYSVGWSTLSWSAGNRLRTSYRNSSYPLKKLNSKTYSSILNNILSMYEADINKCQLNLLDSHDVPRALNTLNNDIKALKIALLIIFLLPGAPCIYYGTEDYMSGGRDPECRESLMWNSLDNQDLKKYLLSLKELRQYLNHLHHSLLVWKEFEKDCILGTLTQNDEALTSISEIQVFINRSRKKSISIPKRKCSPLFMLGSIEGDLQKIGPQSAVVLSLG